MAKEVGGYVVVLIICTTQLLSVRSSEETIIASKADLQSSLSHAKPTESCHAEMSEQVVRPSNRDCQSFKAKVKGCSGKCNGKVIPVWRQAEKRVVLHSQCKCCNVVAYERVPYLMRCPRSKGTKLKLHYLIQAARCQCKPCP